MRAFERALRRTGLPLRTSEGYNPRPRISFPMPLGVGMEGLDEAMTFDLDGWVHPAEIAQRLAEQLPAGLKARSLAAVSPHETAQCEEVVYELSPKRSGHYDARLSLAALAEFMARSHVLVRRLRKGKEKEVDIRPFVLDLARKDDRLRFRFKASPLGSTRPEEVLAAMGIDAAVCRKDYAIVRTRVKLAE